MDSKNQLHCVQLISDTYRHYCFLPPIILSWNSRSKRFYRSRHPGYWMFAVFFILLVILLPSAGFVLTHTSNFTLENILFASVFIPICGCLSTCGVVMYRKCDDITLAFGRMQHLLAIDSLQYSIKKNDKWKKFCKCWRLTLHSFLFSEWSVPVILFVQRLDPLYCVITFYMAPCLDVDTIIFSVISSLRLASLIIGFLESFRTYSVLMGTLFLWLEMQSMFIQCLQAIPAFSESGHFFRMYNSFRIVLKTWEDALFQWMLILMGSLFSMIVLCNVTTLKYWGAVPLSVIWFMPGCSLTDTLIFFFIFPFIVGCHEKTRDILHQRRHALRANIFKGSILDMKVAERQLHCLKPISMQCGQLFVLERDTKAQFYNGIIGRTMDGVLLDIG